MGPGAPTPHEERPHDAEEDLRRTRRFPFPPPPPVPRLEDTRPTGGAQPPMVRIQLEYAHPDASRRRARSRVRTPSRSRPRDRSRTPRAKRRVQEGSPAWRRSGTPPAKHKRRSAACPATHHDSHCETNGSPPITAHDRGTAICGRPGSTGPHHSRDTPPRPGQARLSRMRPAARPSGSSGSGGYPLVTKGGQL